MERVGDGVRVKFGLCRIGSLDPGLQPLARELADAILRMEAAGCCPVLDDGLAAGNGAVLTPGRTVLVSPSGRRPGDFDPDTVVELVGFDVERWEATYRSAAPDLQPTSDAPLHWTALHATEALGWPLSPGASLHGHVLETSRAALELGLPISEEATLFSTPEDRGALLDLLRRAPWPEHPTVIRRDHGFFTLGADLAGASRLVDELAARARASGLLFG